MPWGPDLPRLTNAERQRVHELMDEAADRAEEKRDKHAKRLDELAYVMGCKVRVGKITHEHAWQRIDAYAYKLDPDCRVPLGILGGRHAREIATEAYERGRVAGKQRQ